MSLQTLSCRSDAACNAFKVRCLYYPIWYHGTAFIDCIMTPSTPRADLLCHGLLRPVDSSYHCVLKGSHAREH